MKQKDLAMIILIAGVSAILAFFVSKMFIASDQKLQSEVEVVEPITAEFATPSNKYFNDQSLNPTRLIQIEENQNQNPFQ